MRVFFVRLAAGITLIAMACGGSSSTPPTATRQPATTAVPTRATPAASTSAATAPASGEETEVTGIVGAVDTATGLIEIDRLSGAAVRRLSVDSTTRYRRAGGGSTTLGGVRPSQRIVARGTINDRGDTLLASEITVQDVVQGGQPGG
jgi:hypothetical protein